MWRLYLIMNIEGLIQNYKIEILIAGGSAILLLFILFIIQSIRIRKINKKYQSFIVGNDGKSLEEIILTRFQEVDQLKENMESTTNRINEIEEVLSSTFQKFGVVKYDAFKEMGGKLSFALALLDDKNNGIILNSMHSSREGCYTYAKEIIHGESFVILSEEEKEVLNIALNKKNYME